MNRRGLYIKAPLDVIDLWLLVGLFLIMTLGLVIVTSSSFAVSQKIYGYPWYFMGKQAMHLLLGCTFAWLVCYIPIERLWQLSGGILLLCLILLCLVLVPGIGKEVNGSTRWLNLVVLRFQVSEIVKLGFVIYFASYMVKYNEELRRSVMGVLRPLSVVCCLCFLLLCEPDFGASVVIMLTSLVLLYLAGVRWGVFFLLLLAVAMLFGILAVSSPYRLQRLTAFLDPWINQFDSGYQLTQSLIAFGRAGYWGLGLGEGIQKLFYLPEAHTDFIFAILTEELGLVGAMMLLMLFALCIFRGLWIGHEAHLQHKHYHGYLAQGIAILLGIQVLISTGVNTGMLPTKGLTLPFVSYGGSSLIVYCIAMAILFRVHSELNTKNRRSVV